jgi:uncharacterized protein involved in exopolysaccharide biosynthesis/Mrp family chromosome partitioning ATPase
MALSVLAYLYLPRSYQSEAKLLISVGRESVRLDPTAAVGQTLSVSQSRMSEVNSEVSILESEDLHRALVEDLGAAYFVDPTDMSDSGAIDAAIRKFQSNYRVIPTLDSPVITVSYRHNNPEAAQTILKRLLDLFLEKHIRTHKAESGVSFLRAQAADLEARIDKLREALVSRRNELGVHSVEAHRAALETRRASLETEVGNLESRIASSEAKLKQLDETLEALDETVVVEESQGTPDGVTEELRSKISNLKLLEQDLRSKYVADSPFVTSVQEQIRLAEDLLRRGEQGPTITRRALNPTHQRLELERLLERAALVAASAERQELGRQVTDVMTQLAKLEEHEGAIQAMDAELKVLEAKRNWYLESLEQTRIDEALEREKISNIKLIQNATLPSRPHGPPRAWILIVGLLLSVFVAVVVVLLADYFDRSLLVTRDVQVSLGTEAVTALPMTSGLRVPMSVAPDPERLPDLPARVVRDLELLVGRVLTLGTRNPTIAVAGARRGVGTSTVAYHLSTRLAASGLGRVLLLDGNGLDSGLTSALDLRAEALVQPTTVPRLFAMAHRADGLPPSDHLLEPGEPTTTLAEPRGATLVEATRAANTRTFVIVDLAAVSESASTVERAKHADGTLFVVDPVRTDIHSARLALKNLCDGGANVMGTILNQQTVGGLA